MDNWEVRARVMEDISWLHLAWKRYLERGLKEHGVSMKQAYLLYRVANEPITTPSLVARWLFCDRPTATVAVKTMIKRGWLRLMANPADGRSKTIVLTPSGKSKLKSLPANASRDQPQSIDPLQHLTQPERSQLRDLLSRVRKELEPVNATLDECV
jgi:DNA-binding MarR family transcriptional regulator